MRTDSWGGWGQWDGALFLGSFQEKECSSAVSLREGRSGCFRGGVKPLLANLGTILCPSSSLRERCWGAQQPGAAGQGTARPCPPAWREKPDCFGFSVGLGRHEFHASRAEGVGLCCPTRGSPSRVFPGPAATALVSWPATSRTRLPLAGCSPKSSEPVPGLAAACRSCQDSFPRDHPSWALPFSGKTSCLAAGRELLV